MKRPKNSLWTACLLLTTPWMSAQGAEPLRISLREAIQMALSPDGNRKVEAARADVDEAQAQTGLMRADLLPHLRSVIEQRRLTRNLEALGLRQQDAFRPPRLVGPFSTLDARAGVEQTVFDWSAFKSLDASRSSLQGARHDLERVRDQVAAEVARIYLEALRARADVQASEADVELARSLLETARRRLRAGTGIRIEETRAAVQLSHQQQRLLVVKNVLGRAYLRLQRMIGAKIGEPIELTDRLEYESSPLISPEQARQTARASRADLKALEEKVTSAQKSVRAAWAERLPSLSAFADYGSSGVYPNDSIPTWTGGFRLEIPLFEGGRLKALDAQQRARLRRLEALLEDLRQEIDLEVRVALTGARLAAEQVEVAQQGVELAQEELERGTRRYQAGVAGSLEVTEAQTRLERARDSLNSALFEHKAARVDLEAAMGTILEKPEDGGKEDE